MYTYVSKSTFNGKTDLEGHNGGIGLGDANI